jgi:lantibiotic modifying enzyme
MKEEYALKQLDVSLFRVDGDGRDLSAEPDIRLIDYLAEAGYVRLTRRLMQLSDEDLKRQIELIEMSLYAKRSRFVQRKEHATDAAPVVQEGPVVCWRKAESEKEAKVIAAELARRALTMPSGAATWIGLTYVTASRRQPVQPIGAGMYEGCGGVALFLAGLDRVSDGERET